MPTTETSSNLTGDGGSRPRPQPRHGKDEHGSACSWCAGAGKLPVLRESASGVVEAECPKCHGTGLESPTQ